MASLKLENIIKRFASLDKDTISDFSLTIKDGEFIVFVGPSGCGKSTLLRMIAGLEDVTAGNILLDDDDITEVRPSRRNMAMVFQSYALYPHMNVRQNMEFALKLAKLDPAEMDTRVTSAASMLGLTDYLTTKPKNLSGGQRQRVAIGRAIVREPQLFLFDEPLSNLDATLRMQTRIELSLLHKRLQTTMVYVTHDQVEAMTLADRIVVLKGGEIEQVGTPDEIYEKPNNLFVARFIGTPQMSLLKATVKSLDSKKITVVLPHNEELQIPVDVTNTPIKLAPQASITIGIRPKDMVISAASDKTTIDGEIQLIENLGSDAFLHVQVGGEPVTVRLDEKQKSLTLGKKISFTPQPDKVHFFDSNGNSIFKKAT